MPIQINGTGTITGITAGGYPDATVTADDLAATLDLSGKTVTLPSGVGGSILQVQVTEKTADQEVDSSTHIDIMSVTITPTSSSNPILLLALGGTIITNATNRALRTTFFRGTTNLATDDTNTSDYLTDYRGVNSEILVPHCTFHYDDAHSSSSELTYTYKGLSLGGGVWVNNTTPDRFSTITLMAVEVAA